MGVGPVLNREPKTKVIPQCNCRADVDAYRQSLRLQGCLDRRGASIGGWSKESHQASARASPETSRQLINCRIPAIGTDTGTIPFVPCRYQVLINAETVHVKLVAWHISGNPTTQELRPVLLNSSVNHRQRF